MNYGPIAYHNFSHAFSLVQVFLLISIQRGTLDLDLIRLYSCLVQLFILSSARSIMICPSWLFVNDSVVVIDS